MWKARITTVVVLFLSCTLFSNAANSLEFKQCGPEVADNYQMQATLQKYTIQQRAQAISSDLERLCWQSRDLVGEKSYSVRWSGKDEISSLCTSSAGGSREVVVRFIYDVAYWQSDIATCAKQIPAAVELKALQQ